MKFSLIWGITFRMWIRLLRENRFSVNFFALPRLLGTTAASLVNSIQHKREERTFGPRIDRTIVEESPIFIIGHWRTGTSHVQRLLAQDQRLATPNVIQTLYPYAFLTVEETMSRLLGWSVPKTRMEDNMELSFQAPSEDEVALAVMTLMSPYLLWSFPRQHERYLRFLTFRGVERENVEKWKNCLVRYLRKLTLKHQRRLLLKSAGYTCRIQLLLELFPDAQFIHCCRNPYHVYQSMRHLYRKWRQGYCCFQRWPEVNITDLILKTYRTMYDAYFEQVQLIPRGNLHEIRFEDLDRDPLGEIRKLYSAGKLGGFESVEEPLRRYIHTISHYKKNRHPGLSEEERQRIATEWKRYFLKWNYDI